MCGATEGGLSLDGIDVKKEAIVQGQVVRDGAPVGNAYVRLLDHQPLFRAQGAAHQTVSPVLETHVLELIGAGTAVLEGNLESFSSGRTSQVGQGACAAACQAASPILGNPRDRCQAHLSSTPN